MHAKQTLRRKAELGSLTSLEASGRATIGTKSAIIRVIVSDGDRVCDARLTELQVRIAICEVVLPASAELERRGAWRDALDRTCQRVRFSNAASCRMSASACTNSHIAALQTCLRVRHDGSKLLLLR